MTYNVIISDNANQHLEKIINYTTTELKNTQAAKNIIEDARKTTNVLSMCANSLKKLSDSELAKNGYRKIKFRYHNIIMVYRIVDMQVVVEGIFHQLQDYESLLKR